ncbi:CBS domain-containing protein [Streptomyces sp. YIM S03343]
MADQNAREAGAAWMQARGAASGAVPKPADEFRQDLMVRYLQAVASHSAEAAARKEDAEAGKGGWTAAVPVTPVPELQVRYVMRRTATGISADTPFVDIARMLARDQVGAAPVVDEDERVVGVIAESDLLARAADLAADERPGTLGKLFGRRHRDETAGGTASTLMTAPAVTVHPWTRVLDAARTASHSRVRQIYVTDHKDRLVGVVSRSELLHALVRDDDVIKAEVVTRVVIDALGIDPGLVDVDVRNGVVTLTGALAADLVARLTEAVAEIPDVAEVVDRLTRH